ncbi:MAG: LAGLIDADG family homing endonuclease [Nitrososphaerota archaeon]
MMPSERIIQKLFEVKPILRRYNRVVECPELSYTIAGWLGDGAFAIDFRHHHYGIMLRSVDYEFAAEWGKCLAISLGKRRAYKPFWDKNHQCWTVVGRSVILCRILAEACKDVTSVRHILKKYPIEACRAFFDAEGCIVKERWRYEIVAANYNKALLELVKELLNDLGIEATITTQRRLKSTFFNKQTGKWYKYKQDHIYILEIRRKENLIKFYDAVGFTIRRKMETLREKISSNKKQR